MRFKLRLRMYSESSRKRCPDSKRVCPSVNPGVWLHVGTRRQRAVGSRAAFRSGPCFFWGETLRVRVYTEEASAGRMSRTLADGSEIEGCCNLRKAHPPSNAEGCTVSGTGSGDNDLETQRLVSADVSEMAERHDTRLTICRAWVGRSISGLGPKRRISSQARSATPCSMSIPSRQARDSSRNL